jgi:hypothetical protein
VFPVLFLTNDAEITVLGFEPLLKAFAFMVVLFVTTIVPVYGLDD